MNGEPLRVIVGQTWEVWGGGRRYPARVLGGAGDRIVIQEIAGPAPNGAKVITTPTYARAEEFRPGTGSFRLILNPDGSAA